jgi:glycosyltransferase involved in cell wall biosynthesis
MSRKPRVLRIINRLNLGGPTFNAAYLTKYLEPDFDTLLVSGMKDDTEESSEFIVRKLGLEPTYIPEMYRELHPVRDLTSYRKLVKVIKEFKPDIVHTHAAKAGAVGRLAAYNCKVPVIVHTYHGHVFHSYFSPAKTRLFLEIERYLAKKTTSIITLSNKQLDELSNEFKIAPQNKFTIVPLGFDLHKFTEGQPEKRKAFRNKYHIADEEIAIGIVGRLVPIKNHSLFLHAIKKAADKTTKTIRAFIIGDGEERGNIETLAQELNLFSKNKYGNELLTFTSWIKDVDVANAGLDIICLTSNNEGTPVSLIEAQASAKPIVSTNVGGIEDVVKAGKTALLSPVRDVETFSENLLRVLEDDMLREQMSTAGNDFVLKAFSYERLCSDITTLYKRLLAERNIKVIAESA